MSLLVVNARKLGKIPADYTRIYVGPRTSYRPELGLDFSLLGNPYAVGKGHAREEAVALYRAWLTPRQTYATPEGRALEQLRGRLGYGDKLALVCWCAPALCHAQVIAEVLRGKP